MKVDFPHYNEVHGWLDFRALLFTSYFRERFLSDTEFDSLEIGVHFGKFLIGIENLTPEHGRCIAVDVFSHQDKNIDSSGFGSLETFTANYTKHAVDPKRVTAMEMDSLDIDCEVLGRRRSRASSESTPSTTGGPDGDGQTRRLDSPT